MRVMLAFDGSAGAEAARDLLARLDLPDGVAITLVTVLEKGPELFGAPDFAVVPHDAAEAEALLVADLHEMLRAAAAPLRAAGRRIDTMVLRGRPASAIVDEAQATRPDLIVVGSRGHGPFASVLLGSVSTELVDHAPCPVLVARHPTLSRMVVGVDGSESADRAISTLLAWPLFRQVPVRVVGVGRESLSWPSMLSGTYTTGVGEPSSDERSAQRAELEGVMHHAVEAMRRCGREAEIELRDGDPADQLVRSATGFGAELIVVGSRGLSTLPRLLLGSVARKVLLHAPQSVLVIRDAPARVTRAEPARISALAGMALG